MKTSKRKVLVVGGAGYVGSATVAKLVDLDHEVWILDDFTTGHPELLLGSGFYTGKIGDQDLLERIFSEHHFDCVMHFAAKASVAESVANPELYFENNVVQTKRLLQTLVEKSKVRAFIFSSTAAVFGDVRVPLIDETHPKKPINPYGETKLLIENHLQDLANSTALHSIALRYFNAAGAEPKLRVGEWHTHESHLIPLIFKWAGEGKEVRVFGNDYPTRDKTCVRDYIHVSDLASAHVSAMERILSRSPEQKAQFEAFNLGTETGSTVLEVIAAAEKVLKTKIKVRFEERRPGDPATLIASSKLATKELNFKPQFNLNQILETAWGWEKKNRARAPAVFLDRDGTLNFDPGYLDDPDKLVLFEGAARALKKLKNLGYKLIVVSNQSGVSRGLIPPENLPKIYTRLNQLLREQADVEVDAHYSCLHHPNEGCICRKPSPFLVYRAANENCIDLSRSVFIGDRLTDLLTGRNAGLSKSLMVRTGLGAEAEKELPSGVADGVFDDLTSAADWIAGLKT